MQRSDDTLELALDLYRAGLDTETHILVTVADNLLGMGYTKGVVLPPVIEKAADAIATLLTAPTPEVQEIGRVKTGIGMERTGRVTVDDGVQWGTELLDPMNTEIPDSYKKRKASGWQLNISQKEVMGMFCGTTGHYTVGLQALGKHAKSGDAARRLPKAKHRKPLYVINSLMRRGLVQQIDRNVWILSPRGRAMATYMRWNPVEKPVGVDTVA